MSPIKKPYQYSVTIKTSQYRQYEVEAYKKEDAEQEALEMSRRDMADGDRKVIETSKR